MQALRLNEVLTRVVAWHNRHPLARRIQASQVHSVGEVVLPFASAQPAPAAPAAAPPPPALHELLAPQPASGLALPDPAGEPAADGLPPPGASVAAPPSEAADTDTLANPGPQAPGADPGQAAAAMPLEGPAGAAPEAAPPPTAEDQADELFGGGAPAPSDADADAPADPGSSPAAAGMDDDPFADPAPAPADAGAGSAPAATAAAADDDPFADPSADPIPAADTATPVSAAPDPAPAEDDGPEVLIELPEGDGGTADSPGPADPGATDDPWADPAAADAASAELAAAFAAAAASPAPAAAAMPSMATEAAPSPGAADADGGTRPPAPTDEARPDALADQTQTHQALAQAQDDADAAAPAAPPVATPAAQPAIAAAGLAAAVLPRPGWWARLLAGLAALRPGSPAAAASAATLPRLQATFSRDFIWPMRPGQVARWARRHGSLRPLAPADWPQRVIDTDGALMARARQRQLVHDLPVHVLTAAIGVGDRRIRVLIDAQGRIIGPRSYSPPRLATAASLLALVLVGSGGALWPRGGTLNAQQTAAAVALAASAAAQAASAAELAAAAASAAESVWRAQLAEAGGQPGPAPDADPAAPASPVQADAQASGQAAAAAAGQPHGAPDAPAAAQDHPGPAAPATADGSAPPPRLAALISEADKQAAREQARALRDAGTAPAPDALPAGPREPGPVFAVVTRSTRDRESAARSLALMRASRSRLSGTAPEHGELMRQGEEWRAAWWPFDSQADAERARVMLTARGLKAEVVEF